MADNIMFVGDTHGDIEHWDSLFQTAVDEDVKTIIQVGDFGYWEHVPGGPEYLDELAQSSPVPIYWIDGNHENHPMLWENYGDTGIVQMRWGYQPGQPSRARKPKLTYLGRGTVMPLHGVTFQFMGGSYSIDQKWRQEQHRRGAPEMWWPEEEIRDVDIESAIEASSWYDEIDVLVCHDAPSGAPLKKLTQIKLDEHRESRAQQQRRKLRRLVDHINPKWIIHGHYHTRYKYRLNSLKGSAKVEALGCNPGALPRPKPEDFDKSYVILDTDELKERLT